MASPSYMEDLDDALALYDQQHAPGAPPPVVAPPPPVSAGPDGVPEMTMPAMTVPPAPQPPAGVARGLDPELAALLESRKQRPAEQPASDPNRTLKLFDAIARGFSGRDYDSRYWGGIDQQRRADAQQAQQKRMADPSSEESRRQRQIMGPLLMRMGVEPEEIAGLSAADIASIGNGGKIAMVLADSRRRAQAEAAARAQKQEDAAAAHAQSEEDWNKHNEITSAQALERARVMAGMQGDAFARRMGAEEAARMRAEQRAADRQQREAEAAEQRKREGAQATAAAAEANELVQLEQYERELARRAQADPQGLLPGSEGFLEGKFLEAKSKVAGGTGRSDADARLAAGLNSLGMSAYRNRTGAAANQENERQEALGMFRGNGTNASALAAIRARKAELEEVRKRRAAALGTGGSNGAPAAVPPPRAGMVRMRDPVSGRVADVPAANVDKARARGLEVIGG
jgi:hypothetical protein